MSTYRNDYAMHFTKDQTDRPVRVCVFSWEDHCERRLSWLYGEAEARKRMSGGDPSTEADLAAWNHLGASQERAA